MYSRNEIDRGPKSPELSSGTDMKDSPTREPRRRLLIVASHVVQYSSPVFRKLAENPQIELLVAYCSLQGAEPGLDPGFGIDVSWDTSLLEGYPWIKAPNWSPRPSVSSFFGLFNPTLWKIIHKGHFDAIMVSGYFYASAWIAIAAAKRHSTPIIFITDSHSLQSWAAKSRWVIRVKQHLVRRIFALGKVQLALSSGGVEYLQALGIPSTSIVLTPYAVDNNWWAEQALKSDRELVRKEWNISTEGSVILFCAKLQPWKGPMDLLQAFAKSQVENSYLVFVGDGLLRDDLERKAAQLGVAERVRFLGFRNQSQLPRIYCAADVLVLPSYHEPFGLVVNEAMLCGLPAIVSDRVGARFDLVRPRVNGYVFPVGDVDALAAELTEILSDSALREEMGNAARQRMETWSPQDFANSVIRGVQIAADSNRTA